MSGPQNTATTTAAQCAERKGRDDESFRAVSGVGMANNYHNDTLPVALVFSLIYGGNDWPESIESMILIKIKEKFAQLHIYTDVVDDVLGLDAENRAYCEALADHTCEKCGCLTRDK